MRLWLSWVAATIGAALLLAAGLANATPSAERVLRLNISTTDIGTLDPAINYDFLGWQVGFATCAKLLNYPDKAGKAGTRIVPEVATAMPTVSKDG